MSNLNPSEWKTRGRSQERANGKETCAFEWRGLKIRDQTLLRKECRDICRDIYSQGSSGNRSSKGCRGREREGKINKASSTSVYVFLEHIADLVASLCDEGF